MDSKTYQAKIRSLLGTAHDLHQAVAHTMTEIGDDAGTAEWQTLYDVMQSVGVACGIMYGILTPRPSALGAPAMVCSFCLEPVYGGEGTAGYWYHESENAAEDCGRTDRIRAVPASSVAEGPAGSAEARARSAALDGADD